MSYQKWKRLQRQQKAMTKLAINFFKKIPEKIRKYFK